MRDNKSLIECKADDSFTKFYFHGTIDDYFYAMKPLINENGITIKQLKDLIKDLPEVDENGEDYKVWIQNTDDDRLSNEARTILRLNVGDIIVSI